MFHKPSQLTGLLFLPGVQRQRLKQARSGSYTVTVGATLISVSGLSISYIDNYSTGLTAEAINDTVTSSAIGGTVTVATA